MYDRLSVTFQLNQSIQECKALIEELQVRIKQETVTYEEEQTVIPKLLSSIDEVQVRDGSQH